MIFDYVQIIVDSQYVQLMERWYVEGICINASEIYLIKTQIRHQTTAIVPFEWYSIVGHHSTDQS